MPAAVPSAKPTLEPAKIEQLIAEIDAITESFKCEFGHLNGKQVNWKPDAHTWSVAQNIHHLMVINDTYSAIIEDIRKGTYTLPWIARFRFVVSFFGNLILNSVKPDRKRKMKTFPVWEPSKSNLSEDILTHFESHQKQLKALIRGCNDLIAAQTVISSPANRSIVYSLEKAFEIIVMHERRHLQQARELIAVKEFPA
jgi:hypothetical protein